MYDIHTHLLFDVDDGVTTLDESIKQLKKAYNAGYKGIVLTPHYIKDSNYNISYQKNKQKFQKLKKQLKENNIDLELFLGNEVFANKNIIELLNNKEVSTINNSKYILVEFSRIIDFSRILSFSDLIIKNNLIPIIAHPERYECIQEDYKRIYELKKMGIIIQINSLSILGKYGKKVKKTVKNILKTNQVDVVANDVHSRDVYKLVKKVKRRIKKYTEIDIDLLFNINPKKIINNESV